MFAFIFRSSSLASVNMAACF